MFMVYVSGKGKPKKIHDTQELAEREANRLAKELTAYDVFVFGVVSTIKATEEREPEEPKQEVVGKVAKAPIVIIKKRKVLQKNERSV